MCFMYRSIGEREDLKSDSDITTEVVQGFVHSVNFDIDELSNQNKCIDLQHTFRPIFVQYFKTNLFHRYKAVTFRRVLAEKGFDLKTLESIWNEKKRVSSSIKGFDSIILTEFSFHLLNRKVWSKLFQVWIISKTKIAPNW